MRLPLLDIASWGTAWLMCHKYLESLSQLRGKYHSRVPLTLKKEWREKPTQPEVSNSIPLWLLQDTVPFPYTPTPCYPLPLKSDSCSDFICPLTFRESSKFQIFWQSWAPKIFNNLDWVFLFVFIILCLGHLAN